MNFILIMLSSYIKPDASDPEPTLKLEDIPKWTSLYNFWKYKGKLNFLLTKISGLFGLYLITAMIIIISVIRWHELITCEWETCAELEHYWIEFQPRNNMYHLYLTINIVIITGYSIVCIFGIIFEWYRINEIFRFLTEKVNLTSEDIKTIKWETLINYMAEQCNIPPNKLNDIAKANITNDMDLISSIHQCRIVDFKGLPYFKYSYLFISLVFHDVGTARVSETKLKWRLFFYGMLINIIIIFSIPTIIAYICVYHMQNIKTTGNYVGPRSWSNLAKLDFRKNQELDHEFHQRLAKSAVIADEYLQQFYSHLSNTIGNLVTFVSGCFLALLIPISLINENASLKVTVGGMNLVFFIGIFTTIFTLSKSLMLQPNTSRVDSSTQIYLLDPHSRMEKLVELLANPEITHDWLQFANTNRIRKHVTSFFRYRITNLAYDVIAITSLGLCYWFILPSQTNRIANFCQEHYLAINR